MEDRENAPWGGGVMAPVMDVFGAFVFGVAGFVAGVVHTAWAMRRVQPPVLLLTHER